MDLRGLTPTETSVALEVVAFFLVTTELLGEDRLQNLGDAVHNAAQWIKAHLPTTWLIDRGTSRTTSSGVIGFAFLIVAVIGGVLLGDDFAARSLNRSPTPVENLLAETIVAFVLLVGGFIGFWFLVTIADEVLKALFSGLAKLIDRKNAPFRLLIAGTILYLASQAIALGWHDAVPRAIADVF